MERKKATSRPNIFCTHFRNKKESKSIKYNYGLCFSLIINLIWSQYMYKISLITKQKYSTTQCLHHLSKLKTGSYTRVICISMTNRAFHLHSSDILHLVWERISLSRRSDRLNLRASERSDALRCPILQLIHHTDELHINIFVNQCLIRCKFFPLKKSITK